MAVARFRKDKIISRKRLKWFEEKVGSLIRFSGHSGVLRSFEYSVTTKTKTKRKSAKDMIFSYREKGYITLLYFTLYFKE